MPFCFLYHLCFSVKIRMSFQSFRKPVFENRVAHSTTTSIFWHPFFARGLAQTPAQRRKEAHHREKSAAQGDSKKVVEEECIARALAHNISQQTKKSFFLRNNLHLGTHSLSNGRLTLWRWLCGLVPWLGLTSWLLEWSPGPGYLGPRFGCLFFFAAVAWETCGSSSSSSSLPSSSSPSLSWDSSPVTDFAA